MTEPGRRATSGFLSGGGGPSSQPALTRVRAIHNKTLTFVAHRMGVSTRRVQDIQNEGARANVDTLARYLHALGARLEITVRFPSSTVTLSHPAEPGAQRAPPGPGNDPPGQDRPATPNRSTAPITTQTIRHHDDSRQEAQMNSSARAAATDGRDPGHPRMRGEPSRAGTSPVGSGSQS